MDRTDSINCQNNFLRNGKDYSKIISTSHIFNVLWKQDMRPGTTMLLIKDKSSRFTTFTDIIEQNMIKESKLEDSGQTREVSYKIVRKEDADIKNMRLKP